MNYKVNFVLSNNLKSKIFDHFIGYFSKYSKYKITTSIAPSKDSRINILMRPNLEKVFYENTISIVHHDLNEIDPWMKLENFSDSYNQSKKIVCLNSLQRKILLDKGFDDKKIHIIPHGYDPKFLSLKFNETRSKKNTIGFFSKHYGRGVKGEVDLYELLKRIDRKKNRLFFYGENRDIEHNVAQYNGFESRYYKNLNYENFIKVYQHVDILLMLSFFEGGPASIPEALVSKTYVIAKNIGMVNDFIDHSNGLIVDNLSFNEIADHINRFSKTDWYKSPVNLKKLYSWKQVIAAYDLLFGSL